MGIWDILKKTETERQILTPEQQADVKFVENFHDEGLKVRRGYERQWYINMAYFLDHQWLTWNNTKRALEKPLVPSWRARVTVNKIKPNVLHILSKLVQNKPAYIVLPATSEDADQNKAKTSKKVQEYLHRINQMDALNQRLVLWMIIYGTAFKEPYFNDTRGIHKRKLKTERLKRPKYDELGQETGEEEEYDSPVVNELGEEQYYDINTGEAETEILSPFSIIPESGAKDLKDSQRVMKIVTKPIEYIRQQYSSGKYVHAEARTIGSSLENQLLRLMGEEFVTEHVTQDKEKEKNSTEGFATIKILREKPSLKHPKGREIRVANGVLLQDGPLPYDFMAKRRTIGIVKYDYIEIGDRFWGDTPVTSMIPIATEYNKTISQITEIKNLTSKPKWIAYKESKLPATSITSEPGEVLEPKYVPNVPPPMPVPAPTIPAYVPNMLERGDKDMENTASIHEVSKGSTPPGVSSGVAVQFLQEQDQTVFGPVISRFETKEGEAGTYELEIVKERYKEPRLLKIVGKNNEIEILDFMATDDMPTDVEVQSGSALPRSITAKQQRVIQQFEKGMLGDPANPETQQKANRLGEFGDIDVIYEEAAADEREVEREHKAWESGVPTKIEFYDNHAYHTKYHTLFCKSDRYRSLIANGGPELEQFIQVHIDGHKAKDPAQQMQAEQMAAIREQQGLDSHLKVKEDARKDTKTSDEHAETVSKISTDVLERQTGKGLGGTR